MLLGSVSTGIDNRKIAQKKFVNFRWFKAIHPSLHFGFVGDNGQGESSFFISIEFMTEFFSYFVVINIYSNKVTISQES
tara:strand:- start:110 stop:346 length:237 start_codon:yes stop_codon:yes gene_type:complete